MHRAALGTSCLLLCASLARPARAQDTVEYSWRPFDIALVTPVNIFHPEHKLIGGLSVNILYGCTDLMYGLEIGAVVNRELDGAGGVQLAGVLNLVGGDFWGLQVAGATNWGEGACGVLCIAGLFNRHESLAGVQLAPLVNYVDDGGGGGLQLSPVNWSYGDLSGAVLGAYNYNEGRFAGLAIGAGNTAFGEFAGIQIAAILNGVIAEGKGLQIAMANVNQSWTDQEYDYTYFYRFTGFSLGAVFNLAYDHSGVQLAGGANIAQNDLDGVQLGGMINLALGTATGLQLGGANLAGNVSGVQFGAINISFGELHGVQIGALNIAVDAPIPFMVLVNPGW
jgi:hypothetical protein